MTSSFPQFLGRVRFVHTLAELCDEIGAEFVEIVLVSSPDEAVNRFVRRTADLVEPGDGEAATQVERDGGADAQIRAMYRQLLEVVDARPASRILTTVDGRRRRDLRRHAAPDHSCRPR